jgi:hypothetical protein
MLPRFVAILAVAFIAYGYKETLWPGWPPTLSEALPYVVILPLFFAVGLSMFRAR